MKRARGSQLVDDETLRTVTGLHLDTVRRLVTDRLIAPASAGGGRGRRRMWSVADFRRAALIAVFMRAGYSIQQSAPLVNEFTDTLLENAASEDDQMVIAVYQWVYAFIEASNTFVRRCQPSWADVGWKNSRLLIAVLGGEPERWQGFPNTVWSLANYQLGPASPNASTEEREEQATLLEIGRRAHAAAESYEHAFKLHASRIIRAAEWSRREIEQKTKDRAEP